MALTFASLSMIVCVAPTVSAANHEPKKAGTVRVLPSITSFTLVNADTGKDIIQLRSDSKLNLAALPTKRLNIRADASESVSKVFFQFADTERYRVETSRPFTLGGDKGGRYLAWTPRIGPQRVSVTPFAGTSRGPVASLTFEVMNDPKRTLDGSVRAEEASSAPTSTKAASAAAASDIAPPPTEAPSVPVSVHPAEQRAALSAEPTVQAPSGPPISSDGSGTEGLEKNTVQPNVTDDSVVGKCVGMVSSETSELTVVCNHQVEQPLRAKVLQPDGVPGSANQTLCEFLNATSPIVTKCATTPLTRSALRDGELVVSIERTDGAPVSVPVDTK
ncbi:MAG: hypothetical protein U0136_19715 [Bdellovibrionota bacterium]